MPTGCIVQWLRYSAQSSVAGSTADQVARSMLENNQAMTEASLVLAIRAASKGGEPLFARELLVLHSKNKLHRPQEQLYVHVSSRRKGEGRLNCLYEVWSCAQGSVVRVLSVFAALPCVCFLIYVHVVARAVVVSCQPYTAVFLHRAAELCRSLFAYPKVRTKPLCFVVQGDGGVPKRRGR